jgi:flagellar hook-length control protein FliK
VAPAAPPPATPADASGSTSAPADNAVAAPNQADQSVSRHLDLVRDSRWLDQLARDISQAATRQGQLRFQLNPEHLGALTVEIANGAAGTAIRMTAETDHARTIIADAQPQLIAEVRAHGLRIAEAHVDLNQQGSNGSASFQGNGGSAWAGSGGSAFAQGQHRQPSENSKPFAPTQSAIRDETADSAPRDDGELYA